MNDYKINNLEEYKEIEEIIENIKGLSKTKLTLDNDINLKDEKLEFLAKNNLANIAQFLSFEPKYEGNPRYINIKNVNNTKSFSNQELVEKLIESSNSKAVNIRSFSLNKMKGNKLIYNKKLKNLEEILKLIKENSISNKYTIINENIDINDGGVSGVILGNTIEFAPEDTPKCVDKKGVCSLPRDIGIRILNTVYGFSPELDFDLSYRIEFSLHPLRQGLKNRHTIIWEYEYYDKIEEDNKIIWPNRFSKFIGDKAFGLLVADSLGFNVPRTTVISRKVAPFNFGRHTGLSEKWIRTCPILKEPGKYFTGKSWKDPFKLMKDEEIKGDKQINIASILSQDAVEAIYSGAAIISKNKIQDIIEGVKGNGDDFMLGKSSGINLPINVYEKVKSVSDEIRNYSNELGEVSIEWVYDGKEVWIMQINQLKDNSYSYKNNSRIIVEGNVEKYEKLNVDDGLEALRNKIKLIKNKNIGIELIGDIGITSHFADLLRLNSIPSRIKKNLE